MVFEKPKNELTEQYGSIGISACLLAGGISLPCAYLFEPEKSQIVFMMSFMAPTGIITGLVQESL